MAGYDLPTRGLVSQSDQAMIERPDIPRSKFHNEWTHTKTFDAAKLYPFLVDEILPGDHMSYRVAAYVRMSTPLFPLFSNQRIDTHFFFVPCRLVWKNWIRFMGQQDNPGDSIAYTIPTIVSTSASGFALGGLADHFGLPVVQQTTDRPDSVSCLPFRAYNLIWNQWFRDENLQTAALFDDTDGTDGEVSFPIQPRAKFHDYFTSALPWPQKFTAPTVPVGGVANVLGIGVERPLLTIPTAGLNVWETGTGATSFPFAHKGTTEVFAIESDSLGEDLQIYADLSTATGVAINTFRQAFLVQSLLERDARGGTRYTELVKSHFGVTSPDARLQRSEYIGGGSSPLINTPIAQTATGGAGLGSLGAATTSFGQHSANYAATEHGYIIGLISVRTELSYSQGIHKMWTRSTRYDFYFPALAGLGEQAVLRKELYAVGDPAFDDLVFGYQARWDEYRQRMSEVTNLFRPYVTGNIAQWHLSEQFATPPTLGATFVVDTPPMSRVLAAGALDAGKQYLANIMINRTAVRPLPTFGTPSLLGRF